MAKSDPIEQFVIVPKFPLHIGGVDVSFTNSAMWMCVAAALSILFFTFALRKRDMVPGRVQSVAESSYEFIAGMVRENIGAGGMQYFPLVFTIFMVVFLGNTLGLLPYAFTYTSHLIVNAAMAVMIFLMVVVIGIARHGVHFFSLFLPPGVPWWMAPMIVAIELISFLIRPVTLSVRLFANMMAGHILLKVIAGFAVAFMAFGVGGAALGILPTLFNAVLIGFELLIAFLQAYVFTILTCIYLKDTVELHH